jgi:hypothetical protein
MRLTAVDVVADVAVQEPGARVVGKQRIVGSELSRDIFMISLDGRSPWPRW